MYTIKTIDELEIGDKCLIIDLNNNPAIVTVDGIFLDDGTFTYEEDVWDVSLDKICVLTEDI